MGPELILPAIMLAGTVVSAFGSMAAGNAQAAAYRYNQQSEYVKAQEQLDASRAQAQQVEQENRQKMGQIESAYAAAGVDSDTGTPLQVMHSSAIQGELSRQLTLYRGKIGAINDTNQGTLYGIDATNAANAGIAKAAGTLLTGGTTFLGPSGINIASMFGGGGSGMVAGVDNGGWNT